MWQEVCRSAVEEGAQDSTTLAVEKAFRSFPVLRSLCSPLDIGIHRVDVASCKSSFCPKCIPPREDRIRVYCPAE